MLAGLKGRRLPIRRRTRAENARAIRFTPDSDTFSPEFRRISVKLLIQRQLVAVVLGVGFLFAVGGAFAQQKESKAESQIHALLNQQAAAWHHGDLSAFMSGYWNSSETTFSGPSGIQRGYDAVLDRYRHAYPDRAAMGQLTFSDLEIHMLSSKAAFVLGHWQLKRANDAPGGVFTLILRRFPEGWRIIHDHTSSYVSPQNPPASSH
jgi:ketosteroid isomerase-like protein